MSRNFAVECHKIKKSFGKNDLKVKVLKSATMNVNYGEFLMLIGPSGCGKTTLLSIIAGMLHPDSGKCIVDGHDYTKMTQKQMLDFRSKNIGFIFQSYHLIPTISVAENIAIPLIINGHTRNEAVKKSHEFLEVVGLEHKGHFLPNKLSGGQQQRVAIARSLIHSPKILICDEPTSALDFVTGTKIVELMNQINKSLNTTFVVVTHDTRILKYADRIIHLEDGVIKKETKGIEHA